MDHRIKPDDDKGIGAYHYHPGAPCLSFQKQADKRVGVYLETCGLDTGIHCRGVRFNRRFPRRSVAAGFTRKMETVCFVFQNRRFL
jgi:hypothetical protein